MRMYLRSPIKNGVFSTVMPLFGGCKQKTSSPICGWDILGKWCLLFIPTPWFLRTDSRETTFLLGYGLFSGVEFALSFREGSFFFQSFTAVPHQCFPPIFAAFQDDEDWEAEHKPQWKKDEFLSRWAVKRSRVVLLMKSSYPSYLYRELCHQVMKSESLSTLSRISCFISLVCFVAMVKEKMLKPRGSKKSTLKISFKNPRLLSINLIFFSRLVGIVMSREFFLVNGCGNKARVAPTSYRYVYIYTHGF